MSRHTERYQWLSDDESMAMDFILSFDWNKPDPSVGIFDGHFSDIEATQCLRVILYPAGNHELRFTLTAEQSKQACDFLNHVIGQSKEFRASLEDHIAEESRHEAEAGLQD